ncbi:MAG: uncharacterized protein JWM59_5089 [Verrucomicrobiales bacterium]|nr:uncharacterized protein [Verrucomicrobiales bacterium]
MEGNTLIAGEPRARAGNSSTPGAVVSFERSPAGEWLQTQYLTFPAEPVSAHIGRRLALSGNTLLVSAMTPSEGRVLIHTRSAPGAQWATGPVLDGDTQDELFGISLAMEGDTAVVGASNSLTGPGSARKGAVYVFTRISNVWSRSQRIAAPPEATDAAEFGAEVALSGDWLAVNARTEGPVRSGGRGTAGSTWLYRRSGGTWSLHRKLVPDLEVARETGWRSTALKGGTLVIGASQGTNPVSGFPYGGAAYVYTLDTASGTWSATPQRLPSPDAADGTALGTSVSVEGGRLAVGARGTNRVYTFTRNAGGQWAGDGSFSHQELSGFPFFGERVVLQQGRLAVAASNSSGPGRVYIFSEGGALQAETNGTYALSATNASMLGTVLSDGSSAPVTFEYGPTTAYGFSLAANPGTLQTSGTAQQVYLSVGSLLPQTTYHYRVRAGSAVGNDRTFTTLAFDTGLSDAVDAPQLNWDTCSGYSIWERQTTTGFDGSDAARSGIIPHGQNTTMQTFVTGPGSFSFRWKVSSELNHDYLLLAVNGNLQRSISGETAWEQLAYDVPAGRYLFTWFYTKDASGTAGSDAGWLDTVVWTPASGTAAWNTWRTAQFNAAQLNDVDASGPMADPDRDGLTNLTEACFGTSPLAAMGSHGQTAQLLGSALYLSWPEPDSANGVSATPEWSPEGQTWLTSGQSAAGITARTISVTSAMGTGGTYIFTARLDPTGQPRGLLRLRFRIIP